MNDENAEQIVGNLENIHAVLHDMSDSLKGILDELQKSSKYVR